MPLQVQLLDTLIKRLQFMNTPSYANLYGVTYEGKVLIIGFGYETPFLMKEYSEEAINVSEDEDTDLEDISEMTLDSSSSSLVCTSRRSSTHNQSSPCSSKTKEPVINPKPGPSLASQSSGVVSKFFDAEQVIFPSGIDLIGILFIKNGTEVDELEVKKKVKDIYVTNTPIFLVKDTEQDILRAQYVHEGKFHETNFSIMLTPEFKETFCYLRLMATIHVKLPVTKVPSSDTKFKEFKDLAERMYKEMIFRVGQTDIFISQFQDYHNLHSTIGKIFDAAQRHKDLRTGFEVLYIYGLFPASLRIEEGQTIYAPLAIDYQASKMSESVKKLVTYEEEADSYYMNVEVPFDGLCLANRNRSILDVHSLLLDAAQRIVLLAELHVNHHIEDLLGVHTLQVYHFYPQEELGHPISLIFITDESDSELGGVRKRIHQCLHLSNERPIFTKGVSLKFLDTSKPYSPLRNVHVGLRSSGVKNGKAAFVYGSYGYYHYNQGNISDSGWGCAYRSLQTILSWFLYQGYTSGTIPSHKLIQEALVKMGDKKSDFIGSKKWIGSTEVSYALQCFLEGVVCILINVPKGSDMFTMGPHLYQHFETHGTPVMIGGGVLAHTIIGVDYNEETSDIKFLILDPHYTGEDNVSQIQKKGYVGWKGIDFWDSNAFYNLCFPQRPICF